MRILICSSEAPLPPTTGFRLVVEALVRELRTCHEIHILALQMPDQEEAPFPDAELRLLPPRRAGLVTDARDVLVALARGWPLRADGEAGLFRPALRKALDEIDPDVVHVTGGRLAGVANDLGGYATVLGALDAWHLNVEAQAEVAARPRRYVLQEEARRVRRFQARQFGKFGRVVVVSEQDGVALRALNAALRTEVIPNGVDSAYFARKPATERDPATIVFSGVMSYPPNVITADFLARRIFPLVRRRRPEARLFIVGREPDPAVRALAAVKGVEVTGEVADMRPWLFRATAYVCPMRAGTGIKNKLLEAMASEAPCVATPLALGGLQVTPGVELLVGSDERTLADHVLSLLEDDELAARLGRRACAYARANHDWAAVAQAHERVYQTVRAEQAGDRRTAHSGGSQRFVEGTEAALPSPPANAEYGLKPRPRREQT
jgi:polysaccharide biosynthesis protein PslH